MSDPRLISPLLDGFVMGDPISEHHGVCCCPAIKNETDDKYIVKIISVPASPAQMDALLLTGAYPDEASALAYYSQIANDIVSEIDILKKLSEQEGFAPYEAWQLEPMENGKGYEVYLLRPYNRTLDRHLSRHTFTHLDALNLGLDICAALSVCRRSGYLYVDLKPSNIFVTEQMQYRIGGLGFIRLDSLKYASLSEKYRSLYTPAEISDAYSALNTTIDIYAAGLILYQAYNNGALPFCDDVHPGDKLPAPMYADYEMSEIILKACDPDPSARWQDPMQMGQAIISYIQRNGAKDTPIVPLSDITETVPDITDEAQETSSADINEDQNEESAEALQSIPAEETVEQTPFIEDAFGNFFFLSDFSYDDLDIPENTDNYEQISGEVTDMLNQADELATLAVPEPVIVPEHIDLPELEPIKAEPEEAALAAEEVQKSDEDPQSDVAITEGIPASDTIEGEETNTIDETEDEDTDEEPFVADDKKSHWLRNSLLALLAIVLLTGGYCFYRLYYLLPIDAITLDGNEDSLTVHISTRADESLLQVICVDTYGNQISAGVANGEAQFTKLVPNTAYSIKVVANDFHKVTGHVKASYSTPVQTNIALFDAVTGATDGSVILNFTVEGPDSKDWTVFYSAEGEEERSASITEHRVTLSNLTVGKEYTFRLVPVEELYLTGQDEIQFSAMRIAKAEDLRIVSCMDNTLIVKWSAPESESVSSWTVSCSGTNYNRAITTTDTTAAFTELDHTGSFVIEVKANCMSVGEKVSLAANTATVTDLKADISKADALEISWNTSLPVPADGWLLHYSIAGIDNTKTISCGANTAAITPVIPNATYLIWLTDAQNKPLLSGELAFTTGSLADFSQTIGDITLNRNDFIFQMCKTSSISDWDGEDLEKLAFSDSFTAGEAASFLVRVKTKFTPTDEAVSILYVIYDRDGKPVYTSTANNTWQQMWPQAYCTLSIPAIPTTPGSYTVNVYFNSGLAASQSFTIA